MFNNLVPSGQHTLLWLLLLLLVLRFDGVLLFARLDYDGRRSSIVNDKIDLPVETVRQMADQQIIADNCACVFHYQCDRNYNIISTGEGIIDQRIGPMEPPEQSCPNPVQICCRVPPGVVVPSSAYPVGTAPSAPTTMPAATTTTVAVATTQPLTTTTAAVITTTTAAAATTTTVPSATITTAAPSTRANDTVAPPVQTSPPAVTAPSVPITLPPGTVIILPTAPPLSIPTGPPLNIPTPPPMSIPTGPPPTAAPATTPPTVTTVRPAVTAAPATTTTLATITTAKAPATPAGTVPPIIFPTNAVPVTNVPTSPAVPVTTTTVATATRSPVATNTTTAGNATLPIPTVPPVAPATTAAPATPAAPPTTPTTTGTTARVTLPPIQFPTGSSVTGAPVPTIRPVNPGPLGSACGVQYITPGRQENIEMNTATFAEYPWMIALLDSTALAPDGTIIRNAFICGASLISRNIVMTAAHCVKNYLEKQLMVRAGEWNTLFVNESLPHQDRSVSRIKRHEYFNNATLAYDIALLRLEEPVVFANNVVPICLPEQGAQFVGRPCVATGWGRNAFGQSGKYQTKMRRVRLPVISRDVCQKQLRDTRLGFAFVLNETFTCAGGQENQDTCTGDGGGPLMCQTPTGTYVQAGITSWGINCGMLNVPGVYVDVGFFSSWISSTMIELNRDTIPK